MAGDIDVSNTMKLLNDAELIFPDAISFFAGRPPDRFIETARVPEWLANFVDRNKAIDAGAGDDAWLTIGQYSATNGIILDAVGRYLANDAGIRTTPEGCMITNGAQEAIAICLSGLVGRDKCVLAADPTYVGLTGAADVLGIPVEVVPDDGEFVDRVAHALAGRDAGRPPVGALYLVPDFANPSSRHLTTAERRRLIELADRHDLYILEDVAYRWYAYDGQSTPTMKSLDPFGRVIYIETFAKTFLPGLRLAVMVADSAVDGGTLAQQLAAIKSYVSVNSAPVNQAVLAGFLDQQGYSLADWMAPRRASLQSRRDAFDRALTRHFGSGANAVGRWDVPLGGFFFRLGIGTTFVVDDFLTCAREAGVIAMPMCCFSPAGGHTDQIRLSFSNNTADDIAEGVARLAGFLETHAPNSGRGQGRGNASR